MTSDEVFVFVERLLAFAEKPGAVDSLVPTDRALVIDALSVLVTAMNDLFEQPGGEHRLTMLVQPQLLGIRPVARPSLRAMIDRRLVELENDATH